jgi:Fe-S cluster assembly protein SufD
MNLQNAFQKFNQTQKAFGPWGSVRQNGFNYFAKHGLPNKLDEAWKYTSLKSLPETLLEPQDYKALKVPKHLKKDLKAYLNPEFFHLVFLNGALVTDLSDLKDLKKIKVVGLEEIEQTSVFQSIKRARKQVGSVRQDSMEALNSAFAHSGVVIEVPADTSLGKPLQVLYFQDSNKATYPKTLVKLGRGSNLSLVESFVGSEQKSVTNSVSEFMVQENAKLTYLRVQEEGLETTHVGCSRFFLDKNANLESLTYATGAALNRHNLDVYLLGEYASAQVNGLTLGFGKQHHDNHTLIDHVVGNCTTTQLYKSILDGESRAVFNGKVSIRPDAQKASSEQLNQNLLLTSKAEADSKPELTIYADDVKATHGSTVGQLNAEELFYFLSRAIPREKAVEMLSLGFVNELIDRVSDKKIHTWLHERLLKAYQKLKASEAL